MSKLFNQIRLYFIVKKVISVFLKNPFACDDLKKFAKNSKQEIIRNYKLLHFSYKKIDFVVMHTYKDDMLILIELYIDGKIPEKIYEVEIDNT